MTDRVQELAEKFTALFKWERKIFYSQPTGNLSHFRDRYPLAQGCQKPLIPNLETPSSAAERCTEHPTTL